MRPFFYILSLSTISFFVSAGAQPTLAGLLPIDEANQVSAEAKTPGTVTIHFKIADGYYLYREQMKFIAGKDTLFGDAKLPDGAKFHDEFAGDVQIYHGSVDASVPYTAAPGVTTIHFTVGYQGCHEVEPKLCYPPHKKSFDVAVTAGSVSAATPAPAAPVAETAPHTGEARYEGSAEAQAAFKEADTARKAGKIPDAIVGYKKAIDLDPNYAKAHFEYVLYEGSHHTLSALFDFAAQAKLSREQRDQQTKKNRELDKANQKGLIDFYTKRMAEHPDQAIYPWALGLVFIESDLARQQELCERAVKIDPPFAPGYECLGMLAGVRVSAAKELEYMRQAFKLAPNDEEIAGIYASVLGDGGQADAAEIKALLQKFPNSYPIAMTLAEQANTLKPESARIAALDALRKDGSKPAANYAAEYLYTIYIDSDLEKARALTTELAGPEKKDGQWAGRLSYVEALIHARADLAAKKTDAALAALKAVEKQKDQGPDKQWYLTQAQALDASGKSSAAITLLRDSFVAAPSDQVLDALHQYGTKAGKSTAQIDADIWSGYQARAQAAKPLKLKRLDNGQDVSLADYKGKPIIVDFWYPQCGPCRASFPYLQKIAVKYKDKGLTVLAVNSIEDQQPFALPYLVQKKYDFVGLAGSEAFSSTWGVEGYPTTFLIGADGRVYMKPTIYDAAHQRSTELAIEQMLAHGS